MPLGTGNRYTVSCPAANFCQAVTDTGYAYAYRNGARPCATDIYPTANDVHTQATSADYHGRLVWPPVLLRRGNLDRQCADLERYRLVRAREHRPARNIAITGAGLPHSRFAAQPPDRNYHRILPTAVASPRRYWQATESAVVTRRRPGLGRTDWSLRSRSVTLSNIG